MTMNPREHTLLYVLSDIFLQKNFRPIFRLISAERQNITMTVGKILQRQTEDIYIPYLSPQT